MFKEFMLKRITNLSNLRKNLINRGKNLWSSKAFIKFNLVTNGLCLGHTVNKLVGSPLPTIFDCINLFMQYNRLQNFFGLSEIIFIQGFLLPTIHLASICSLILFVSTFFVLTLFQIRSDKDYKTKNFGKLSKIPISKYIQFGFMACQISMAGFIGTILFKVIVVLVCKDCLYKAAQISSYEEARIFHSFGLKKTVTLMDSIKIVNKESRIFLSEAPKFRVNRYVNLYAEYPKLALRPVKNFLNDILLSECQGRLEELVQHNTMLLLIDNSFIKVSEEVRLYFVASVLYYQTQLSNCYKLLL